MISVEKDVKKFKYCPVNDEVDYVKRKKKEDLNEMLRGEGVEVLKIMSCELDIEYIQLY